MDELIADCEKLRVLLNKLADRLSHSGTERTFHLKRIMGDDCRFATKSRDLFVEEDFNDLMKLVADVNDEFIILQGKVSK